MDKLFATLAHVEAIVSDQGNLWKHELGTPYPQEVPPKGVAPASATAVGPMPASGTIPPQYQTAFDFASNAMKSIANLPDAQKDLKNYAVLFVDSGDTIWMEFAPVFGPDETPHLGCQTQMGRDMVFGYLKKQAATGQAGKFLQCF